MTSHVELGSGLCQRTCLHHVDRATQLTQGHNLCFASARSASQRIRQPRDVAHLAGVRDDLHRGRYLGEGEQVMSQS
jgi:hypothetical protein